MYYIPTYFDSEELVCKHVHDKHGDKSLMFFDPRILKVADWIRERLNKPVYVNNWDSGGTYDERGLRCILCPLVKDKVLADTLYLSGHIFGRALDLDVQGMVAEEVRQWIYKNRFILPFPVRLEANVTWVHIDVQIQNDEPVYIFKVA